MLLLWLLGYRFKFGGNLIHTLLVIILIIVIIQLLT
ncbi:MAG: lmo0937 family membrane protein [Candidatus Uhrbacteria bacterium]|nr:lmo0937 family membrane protein [Candidatus Uhrbacteria bacterium]